MLFVSFSPSYIFFASSLASLFCAEPYPYCLKVFWDGKENADHAEIPSWGEHKFRLQELWNMQCQPEVIRMKNVRLQIRGAAESNALFHFPHKRTQDCTRQVKNGKDKDGKQKYKTQHYKIDWDYTNGLVHVKTDFGGSPFEQGFGISMTYSDGIGFERGGSFNGKRHDNGKWTIGENVMGINHKNYQMTGPLSHILGQDGRAQGNANNVRNGVATWQNKLKEFRMKQLRERYWENYALSWTFWYLVYNNDVISMEQIRRHFQSVEQNPNVKTIPETYEKELGAMTEMISFFNSNPCIGFWYVYWHDLYKNNSDLPGVKANKEKFDPTESTSVAFKPMGRKELETFLSECEGENPLGKKQSEHLDLLFARVETIGALHPPTATGVRMGLTVPTAPTVSGDGGDIEIQNPITAPASAASSSPGQDDGSAVWCDFGKNPVSEKADPKNVTIIQEKDFGEGSAIWAMK